MNESEVIQDANKTSQSNVVPLPTRIKDDSQRAVSSFVQDHPLLTVAGGIAVGLLAGALLPRRAGQRMARRSMELAEMAGAVGTLFGRQALERAETATRDLRKQSELLAGQAEKFGKATSGRIEKFGHVTKGRAERLAMPAEQTASSVGRRIAAKASALKSRIRG